MAMTPRIRTDLKAVSVEESGIRYFDIQDPRSGHSMRLYDFEWLIAERLDGTADLAQVADWAERELGFSTSPGDLTVYAQRLGELGFVDPTPASRGLEGAVTKPIVEERTAPKEDATAPTGRKPTVDAAPSEPAGLSLEDEGVEIDMQSGPVPSQSSAPAVESHAPRHPPAGSPKVRDSQKLRAVLDRPDTDQVRRPTKSAGLLWIGLTTALCVIGVGVYYFLVAPAFAPIQVKVVVAPAPHEVVRRLAATATVLRSEPFTLAFSDAGKVADVVAPGTDVKPGMTLASLDGLQAIQKELADVKDRETYYATQLKSAQTKGSADEIKKVEAKLLEKRKRLTELEEREKRARLVAPSTATVAEVMTPVGTLVKEGEAALKLVDKRMVAEFKMAPAEVQSYKPGAPAAVALPRGNAIASVRIISASGSALRVELLDDAGGAIKAGDPVVMARWPRLTNVIGVPTSAVSKGPNGERIFVLSGGEVHARAVALHPERAAEEVYVTAGLAGGEAVVVASSGRLEDGQKAIGR